MEYGFEARISGSDDVWVKSARRFRTLEEAGQALAKWLIVCFENSMPFEGRLIAFL